MVELNRKQTKSLSAHIKIIHIRYFTFNSLCSIFVGMNKERVEVLDSFRFLAIMAVMFMHFTYRWTPPAFNENLYPYGNAYGTAFYYGYLGVEFFFIISGFVISYTLENTSGMASFFKNRFIRLFPPMLLCSLVTYFLCLALDDKHYFENAHSVRNFLPSLTFTNPSIWVTVTKKDFSYISLSYWSLWVEVQFYFVSAILFFSSKKFFLRNLIILTIILSVFNAIPDRYIDPATYNNLPNKLKLILSVWFYNRMHFDIKNYISWFTIGVVFHHLFKRRKIQVKSFLAVGILFIFIFQFFALETFQVRIAYLIMLGLFFCMIYKKNVLTFLDIPMFRRIGMISYSVYLIHEIAGVLLINKYGKYLGSWSFVSPFLVALLVICFAELSYRYYEKKSASWLKKILFRSKSKQTNTQEREVGSLDNNGILTSPQLEVGSKEPISSNPH